jgi:hypothetical protein
MNRILLIAASALALVACVAESEPEPKKENVEEAKSELAVSFDDSKYCLPDEVVKCSPPPAPPVCKCVPKPTTAVFLAR